MVKSLTKKNCKEIDIEYVGKSKTGGIDYSYRGLIFNQEVSRSYGTIIGLMRSSFSSEVVLGVFRQIYQGKTDTGYQDEFDLSELKGWMDSIANAAEEAEKKAQAPITEEEIQDVTSKIRKQKQLAWHKTEQAKKFAWWENENQTCKIIRKLAEINGIFQAVDCNKDNLAKEEVSIVEKHGCLHKISNLLDQVQKELDELEALTKSK